jgi:hypothetical protein
MFYLNYRDGVNESQFYRTLNIEFYQVLTFEFGTETIRAYILPFRRSWWHSWQLRVSVWNEPTTRPLQFLLKWYAFGSISSIPFFPKSVACVFWSIQFLHGDGVAASAYKILASLLTNMVILLIGLHRNAIELELWLCRSLLYALTSTKVNLAKGHQENRFCLLFMKIVLHILLIKLCAWYSVMPEIKKV